MTIDDKTQASQIIHTNPAAAPGSLEAQAQARAQAQAQAQPTKPPTYEEARAKFRDATDAKAAAFDGLRNELCAGQPVTQDQLLRLGNLIDELKSLGVDPNNPVPQY